MWIGRSCVAMAALGCAMRAMGGVLIGLGDLPGGGFASSTTSMSADGRVVVGASDAGTDWDAFVWFAEDGLMRPLVGARPQGVLAAYPRGVALGARAVVGFWEGTVPEAFRWTPEGGFQGLGHLPSIDTFFSDARGVSGDGNVVVGYSTSRFAVEEPYPLEFDSGQAFLWTPERGMVGLGFGAGAGAYRSSAAAVSSDGSVIAGSVSSGNGYETQSDVFRWTAESGITLVGGLPGLRYSDATAISADGSVIVGRSTNDDLFSEQAFRWSAADGMREVPGLAGADWVRPRGVSGDGSIVVGESVTGMNEYTAFIWTAGVGTRPLIDVLREAGVAGLEGWQLITAQSVSADGLTIAGSGINPSGVGEAWIVTVPPPGSAAVAVIGAAVLGWRERRLRG